MEKINYIVFDGSAKDCYQAIDKCVEKLVQNNITDMEFSRYCKEREKEYPTGLPTSIPVAIPHASYENIKNTSICIMKLKEPVDFYRMDESDSKVGVRMVFNIAAKDPNNHLTILQNLINIISDENKLKEIVELDNEELVSYLKEKVG